MPRAIRHGKKLHQQIRHSLRFIVLDPMSRLRETDNAPIRAYSNTRLRKFRHGVGIAFSPDHQDRWINPVPGGGQERLSP